MAARSTIISAERSRPFGARHVLKKRRAKLREAMMSRTLSPRRLFFPAGPRHAASSCFNT
jgi:hypothetical protein